LAARGAAIGGHLGEARAQRVDAVQVILDLLRLGALLVVERRRAGRRGGPEPRERQRREQRKSAGGVEKLATGDHGRGSARAAESGGGRDGRHESGVEDRKYLAQPRRGLWWRDGRPAAPHWRGRRVPRRMAARKRGFS